MTLGKSVELPGTEMVKEVLWGIPGTEKVPSPEKEIKKLVDKAKREIQHELDEIADEAKAGLNKVGNGLKRDIRKVGQEIEHGIAQAADEIEDGLKAAFYALAEEAVHLAVNDLVDAIQAKLFQGPIFVKLWWFRFYIDPDSKIDALQAAAKHPPKGKRQIVALIRELVDDDVVEFRPEVPLLAAFGGKVKVEQIDEAIEYVVKKLGI